ncbi:hypothetical protein PRZ48_000963 [Zasmidium cellare]|uniref:Uncharacterized protein n=1 Tax=Zasmidium cellare TaxID=395010 RepID=A0ABR0F191_ZASCE|nr:hypothetical protein PRZ48_000963 [Zasmidium cellare]
MGETVRYLHTSLYTFSAAARTAILTRFNSEIGNGTVKCWYDNDRDSFILESPTALGLAAVADERLGTIIETYVRQELEAAEEDERPPTIKRFKEALFIDLSEIDQEYEEVEVAPLQPIRARSHLLKVADSEGKRLRFMPLYTLPDRLLERTLAPENPKVNKVLIHGLTCRAVRWDNRDGEVFNGRTGIGLSLAKMEAELPLPAFSIMRDTRPGVDGDGIPGTTWEHVGDPPTVEQWVQGTGQTRQMEPEERADMPKDARKYLATGPTNPGRLRVPKGQDLLPPTPQEEPIQAQVGTESRFNDLLAGKFANAETDEEEDEESDDDDDGISGKNLADVLKGGSKKGNAQGDWGIYNPQMHSSTPSSANAAKAAHLPTIPSKASPASQVLDDRTNTPTPTATPTPTLSNTNTATSAPQTRQFQGDFPEYGNRFSKVDDVGLMGNAANAAEWDRDNHVHRSPKKKSKPVVARSAATRDGSRAPQSSTAPTASLASLQSQNTVVRQDFREADWVNKPVIGKTQGPKLIDDAATFTSGPVRVPPGFEEPTGPSPTPGNTNNDSDGEIHENVKKLPSSFATKRDTMRQKAGKKGKNKKVTSKPPVPKAQLPLPEPPPPPKRKQKEVATVPVQVPRPEQTAPSSVHSVESSDEDEPPQEVAATSTSLEHSSHAFGKFLLAEKQRIIDEDEDDTDDEDIVSNRVRLVASIGVLLTRPMSKEFNKGVQSPAAAQKQLNASWETLRTDLFTRLTTSKEDAAYMLELVGGNTDVSTAYEIWTQDASGTQLIITVPSHDKMDYKVKLQDASLAEAYAHYPMHVWDSMFALMKPGKEHISSSDEAIKEFITSMQTDDDGTSFNAIERVGLLTIQRVLAKRIYTKKAKGGTLLQVTQVQDMGIESLNDKLYNFKAEALSYLEMAEIHRLWWEMRWEAPNLDKAGLLEMQVDEMVKAMDVVGLENIGPYHYAEPEDEEVLAPVVPFW